MPSMSPNSAFPVSDDTSVFLVGKGAEQDKARVSAVWYGQMIGLGAIRGLIPTAMGPWTSIGAWSGAQNASSTITSLLQRLSFRGRQSVASLSGVKWLSNLGARSGMRLRSGAASVSSVLLGGLAKIMDAGRT